MTRMSRDLLWQVLSAIKYWLTSGDPDEATPTRSDCQMSGMKIIEFGHGWINTFEVFQIKIKEFSINNFCSSFVFSFPNFSFLSKIFRFFQELFSHTLFIFHTFLKNSFHVNLINNKYCTGISFDNYAWNILILSIPANLYFICHRNNLSMKFNL